MGVFLQINRASEAYLNNLGASNSPEMRAAAQAYKKKIRKVLGIKGNGKPSKPGEPPRKQSGRLQQSVKDGPVGDKRRVAVTDFTASLMQDGVDTVSKVDKPMSKPARRAKNRRDARRAKTQKKVEIERRPFMEQAFNEAQTDMGDVMVAAMQQRAPSTTL